MWVSRKCSALRKFDERIAFVFDTLDHEDCVKCIQIVARPTPTLLHTLWRITFNDLENRLLNLEKYICVRHCIFAIHLLQKKYLVANNLPSLSSYNVRLVTIRDILRNPKPKDWRPENFLIRFDSLLKSIRGALNERNNTNVFTHVNLFEKCRSKDLKLLSRQFGRQQKFYKEMILLLS